MVARGHRPAETLARCATWPGRAEIEGATIADVSYEHGSTIFTSNRALEEWPPLFGDMLLAGARARPAAPSRARDRDGRRHVPEPPAGKRKAAAAKAA